MRKQAKRARVEAMKGPQEVTTNSEKESKPDDMAVDAG